MRVKFNTAKKKAGLEIMTLNHEKMQHVSNLIELMSKGGATTLFTGMF